MTNFVVVDGENYWCKFEDYVRLYNERELTVIEIREQLGISSNKAKQYRRKAIDEGRLIVIGYQSHGKLRE